jgi:hypothetical protein
MAVGPVAAHCGTENGDGAVLGDSGLVASIAPAPCDEIVNQPRDLRDDYI